MDLKQVLKCLWAARKGDWLGVFMVGGEVELGILGIVCTSHWYQRKKHPGFLVSRPKCWAIGEDGLGKPKSCPQIDTHIY